MIGWVPPSTPTLTYPSNGATLNDSTPDLAWTQSGDFNYFHVQISTNSSFTSIVRENSNVNAFVYTPSDLSDGTYYWRVCAYNGGWGNWSSYRSFVISTWTPPSAPILTYPSNGATLSDSTPNLAWTQSGSASYFHVQISTNSSFTGIVRENQNVNASNYTPSALSDGTYYWRVRAYYGGWGGWSSYRSFIISIFVPSPPSLIAPSGNVASGRDVAFQWNTSSGAARYRLKICTDAQMTNQITGSPFEPEVGVTNYTVPSGSFTTGQTYYWQAGAIAANDVGGWGVYGPSPAWSITIVNVPSPPNLIAPSGNIAPGMDVTFQWNTSSGAARYRLKICIDAQMTNQIAGSPFEPEVGVTNYTVPSGSFTTGQTYYWQVGAIAVNDVGGWGVYGPSPAWVIVITEEPKTGEAPTFVPLHRLYKGGTNNKDHFYTISEAERDNAENNLGYVYERIEGYVSSKPFEGGVPLYRLFNNLLNSHFYTADDLAMLTMLDPSQGYVLENGSAGFGVEAYVYPSFVEGMVPMYRINECSIESPGHYFMCIREHEYKSALTNPAWCFDDEGLVAYVSPDGVLDPLAHRRPQANFGGADLGTGAYRGLNSLDLLMKGRGPDLGFAHYYNSFNFAEYPMGPGWSHNLDSYIIEEVVPIEDQASEKPNIYVKWGDGSGSAFQSTGTEAGEYKDLTGNHDLLTRIDDGVNYGYDLTKKDQTVYQYRRLSINPPPEVASFCSANPENVFCNKIVLLRISDWAGNTLTFEYDAAAAYLLAVRDDMGRRLELDYHVPSNLLKSITERVSGTEKRTVSFSYNTEDLLETFADANGEITRYSYYNEPATQRHQLLKTITYPMLNTVTIDYDQVTGKVTSVKDAASSAPGTIDYTPQEADVSVTDPENNIVDYRLDGVLPSAVKGRTDANWATIERTDANNPNLPTKTVDQKGKATQYQYDARGNLTWIKNAADMVATFSYNLTNTIASSSEFYDPNGTVPTQTTFAYDTDNNRLRTITNPAGETLQLGYGAYSEVNSLTDALTNSTTFLYDTYGNLKQITDGESNATKYSNDYAGRAIEAIDGENIKTTYTYDNTDHPKDVVNYTRSGAILRTIGRMYDVNGNLDSVNWTNQGTPSQTKYLYDNRDRLGTVIKPGGADKIFSYYENDLVKTVEDYNNQTVSHVYDDHNRLKEKQYPDGSKVTFGYDENGNLNNVTAPSGNDSFVYDDLNRIETHANPDGKTVSYDYDNAGRLRYLTYPNGHVVTYTYDAAGRLKTVSDWQSGRVAYMYDPTGKLTEARRSADNGTTTLITTVYTYDNASRLKGIAEKQGAAILLSYAYTLDGVGNHESVDTVNEPLSSSVSAENISYTNDKARNLVLSAGQTTYTYDNNGNRKTSTSEGVTTTYSWDFENRLTGISTPDRSNITYTYDGMGNRISRTENGVTTRYVLDLTGGMSRVLAETDDGGNVTAYYIYGHGLVSRIDANTSERCFYHFNHRGDTVALTDDSGAVTDRYAYGEYGRLENSSATGTATENPFKYVGRYGVMVEGNDLLFMRARFYDVAVGRFLSEDPLGFGGGDWNLSAYVGGNPVVGVDPEGEALFDPASAIASTLVESPFIFIDGVQQTYFTCKSIASAIKGDKENALTYLDLAADSSENIIKRSKNIIIGSIKIIPGDKMATKVFGKTGYLKVMDMRFRKGIVLKIVWTVSESKIKGWLKNTIKEKLLP